MPEPEHDPDLALIQRAAKTIARGQLVAFPTETVYGLGADALNPTAIGKVFAAKGRPATNPLIVHVADQAMAQAVTSAWPDTARKLADTFWPGPLSIILPKANRIPAIVTAGGETVAVRCPDHPIALKLICEFNGPIVAPSANRSGSISPTTAQHVANSFPDLNLLILDGGPCTQGIESTVVSLAHSNPTILRPGNISLQQLTRALGRPVDVQTSTHDSRDPASASGPSLSPGTHPSHYAPASRVALFRSGEFESISATTQGTIIALVINDRPRLSKPSCIHIMPKEVADYARALYAALHSADAQCPALIAIELPGDPTNPVWHAVLDRLYRAAAPR